MNTANLVSVTSLPISSWTRLLQIKSMLSVLTTGNDDVLFWRDPFLMFKPLFSTSSDFVLKMLGEKFDNDPSLEESKYTVLSIDCCSWIQDTEINACLEESEHAALNFSKIGSLLTLIVSRENEDTKVFVYAVASTFKAHRVNFTFSSIKTHLLFMWDPCIFLVKHRFVRNSWDLLLTSARRWI